MNTIISTIEQAEDYIRNLKRSNNNWVSDETMLDRLETTRTLIEKHQREDLLPYWGVNACLYHIDKGEFGLAWENAELAEKYAEKYSNYECILNALSLQYRVQRFLGNLERAQEIVNKQIEIALLYKDPHLIGSAYLNQGALFHRLGLKEDCIEANEEAIFNIKKSRETYYISMFQLAYSGMLLDFGMLDKADKYLQDGYAIAFEQSYIHQQALAKSNFGFLYQLQNKEELSVQAFYECIALYTQLNNTSDAIMGKIMLADALVHFNRTDEAEKIMKETIEFSEKNQLKYNLIGTYDALANLYEKNGNYKESLYYLRQLIRVKEEYLNNESEKRIRNLEMMQKVNILKMEKATAEQLAHAKHDFLANMSHEIRTPINSILGICYLLQQQSLNDLQQNYIHRLQRSGEGLLGIVNDILDISKIESGKMELVLQPFSLQNLVQDIYNALEPKANEKGILLKTILSTESDLLLMGDPVRMYQVLLNLVSNAIKFTPAGSVTMEVRTAATNQEKLIIEFIISDTGIGIAQEKINRIFERYEQADASIKNTFGGTGLGLSISRKIIELMQGIIHVKSEHGKGTEFIVTIPFETDHNPIKSPEITAVLPKELLDNKRILIADDNEENRLVAKEILLHFNTSIELFEAANGQEVLDILEKNAVDVIFIDLDMPVLNGIETIFEIRKQSAYKNIPVIGNTASLSTLSREEMLAYGFDDFLSKPYKATDLIQIIISKSK